MPVSWGPVHRLHASLYYTIESLNLDKSTHAAVFTTMHKEGNMLQTEKRVQDFLSKFGIAPEISKQYLNSFTIKQKINRDAKQAKQLLITATPMIVVDGTYIIEAKGSYSQMLDVVDFLVELQRPNS
jgi:thiol:disulfide interchange protein DsbA